MAVLDLHINTLEARNPARGCLRHYRVEAGTDLFGNWLVEIGYGRIGAVGRSRSYVVRDEAQARRLVQRILKRRTTAPRRIGVAYRILESSTPPVGRVLWVRRDRGTAGRKSSVGVMYESGRGVPQDNKRRDSEDRHPRAPLTWRDLGASPGGNSRG